VAKSPVGGLDCHLKIGFKGGFFYQPNLTDLETSQLATPQQPPDILQAVSAEISSSLNRYVVVHYN